MATEFCFLTCSAGITRFIQHLENFKNDLIWSWVERVLKTTSSFSPETKELSLSREVAWSGQQADQIPAVLSWAFSASLSLLNLLVLVPKSKVLGREWKQLYGRECRLGKATGDSSCLAAAWSSASALPGSRRRAFCRSASGTAVFTVSCACKE